MSIEMLFFVLLIFFVNTLTTASVVHTLLRDYHEKLVRPLFALQEYQRTALTSADFPKVPNLEKKKRNHASIGEAGNIARLNLGQEDIDKLQTELMELY